MPKLTKEQQLIRAIKDGFRYLVIQPRSRGDRVYEELLRLVQND